MKPQKEIEKIQFVKNNMIDLLPIAKNIKSKETEFKEEDIEYLDKEFPKGKTKFRGQAMVLLALAREQGKQETLKNEIKNQKKSRKTFQTILKSKNVNKPVVEAILSICDLEIDRLKQKLGQIK